MAEPEPPPAGVATFVCKPPIQSGSAQCSIAQCMRPAARSTWNESLDLTFLPAFGLSVIPLSDESTQPLVQNIAPPPPAQGPVRASGPDVVFSFVQSVASTEPAACAIPVRFAASLHPLPPTLTAGLSLQPLMAIPAAEPVWAAVHASVAVTTLSETTTAMPALSSIQVTSDLPVVDVIPDPCEHPVHAPEPEPVWAFVAPAAALIPALRPAAIALPHMTSGVEPMPLPDAPAAPALQPEPVASFVQPVAAFEIAAVPAAIRLPRFTADLEPLPLPDAPAAPALQAEPVAAFVQPAAIFEIAAAPAAIQLPRFTAEAEPMPIADELTDPPAVCEAWMRAPKPEPVFAFVQAVSADAALAALALREPGIADLSAAGPYIPTASAFRAAPAAEPVMAGVWPHVADISFEPILSAAAIELPSISALRVPAAQPQPTPVVAAPRAEAAETLLNASQSDAPLVIEIAAKAAPLPQLVPAAVVTGPKLAAHSDASAPEPVESILTAAAAAQIQSAPVVRLQPFAVAASEGRGLTSFDAPRLASPATQPPAAAAGNLAVTPISTIHVTAPPQPKPLHAKPGIPAPDMVPLEFHAQPVRGKSVCKLEWRNVRFTPIPPRFGIKTIWEKTELVSKPVPQKSSMAEIFTMPEAKPKSSKWAPYAVKIAAGIVVLFATWYGASSIKMDRALQVRAGGSSTSHSEPIAGVLDTSVSRPSSAAAKNESKGALTGVRASIARRAAVQITDSLRDGMEAWGATAKTYPAGWSKSTEGYVRPGALALFSPTKSFTDYRMEFFGQIEQKGIGWTVRSKDEKNYHAMKFSVIEAGLRPIIAMVHYSVVNGKPGKRSQTPLNVMVHNNRPFQVAVSVKGNHFTTSVDGEEVDSFSDDALPSGGIGFFADAGEKARLYWVKVSKNDDWLGHVCAFLSGVDAAPAGAELWAPELPGSPAPTYPDTGHATLAGAWMAAPFARASRKARNAAKSRRYFEWNT